MNLAQLIDGPVGAVPSRTALVVEGREISYRELGAAVGRAGAVLRSRGVAPGQRVALLDQTGLLLIATVLGAARVGASAVPLHTQLTAGELRELVKTAACVPVGVAGDRYATTLSEALGSPALTETELLAPGAPDPGEPVQDPDAECLALLTSGTTGLPKPVGMSHATLTARMLGFAAPLSPERPAAVGLLCAPGVHIGGLGGLLVSLAGGNTTVVQPRFEPGEWLRLVERHRVAMAFLVPTMLRRILDHPDFDATDLGSLRAVTYGAAAAPVELVEEMIRRFPDGVAFSNVFGQTETTGAIAAFGPDDHVLDASGRLVRAGSVGRIVPGVETRIVDPDSGEDVPPGQSGELWVRSSFNAEPGWRQTGDLVRVDAEGYLFPTGRLSDTINRGGEKFGPGEIEAVLREHPDVLDAAVAGVPDPEMGERVGAAIVATRALSAEEVAEHCRGRLARFKVPERIALVDEIPHTELWKVSRRVIADLIVRQSRDSG